MEWLIENENHVLEKRFINFARVYGDRFEESQRNLYKYFAKSFGCRLVDAGYAVPMDVVNLLRLTHFHTGLSLTFTVNEANLIVSSSVRNGFIGKGDLIVIVKDSDPTEIRGFFWSEHISWFTIFYCYGRMPDGDLGSTWVANSQHIYLGSYQTATDRIG
jgi:hypothetical protein